MAETSTPPDASYYSNSDSVPTLDHSDSDTESDSESDSRPPWSKRAQAGAATYRTKFNSDWKKEFPFITLVNKDPYR